MSSRSAEYPRPQHFLVHISDTHFPATGLLHGIADTQAYLINLLDVLESSGVHPEAFIFTGDLADRGNAEAYRRLRGTVEPVAKRIGAEVIWVMGNHDDRPTMRTELLGEKASNAPYDHVFMLGGLRVIVFDSTVPGQHYGEFTIHQLDWLASVLADPAPEGTILAMHHPPIPCVQDLAVTVELRDQVSLAEIVRHSDIRIILAGHLHYSTSSTFAGIPVSVASATCYTQDLQTPHRGTRGRNGAQAYNLVHVYNDQVMNSVVPIGSYPTAGRFVDEKETAIKLSEAKIFIPSELHQTPHYQST